MAERPLPWACDFLLCLFIIPNGKLLKWCANFFNYKSGHPTNTVCNLMNVFKYYICFTTVIAGNIFKKYKIQYLFKTFILQNLSLACVGGGSEF